MQEGRRNLLKLGAVFVVAFLLGAGVVFLMAKANVMKGDRGERGFVGDVGPVGPVGLTGAAGAVGPMGVNGSDGKNGARGAVGPVGPPGKDAPLNRLPVITLVDLNMTTVTKYCRVNYSVVVTILDPDGDNFQATFFVDAGDGFVPVKQAFGSDGDFVASIMLKPPKSMSWLVEVWDGQDIALAVFDYVIC